MKEIPNKFKNLSDVFIKYEAQLKAIKESIANHQQLMNISTDEYTKKITESQQITDRIREEIIEACDKDRIALRKQLEQADAAYKALSSEYQKQFSVHEKNIRSLNKQLKQSQDAINELAIVDAIGRVPNSVNDFVRDLLAHKEISVTYRGDVIINPAHQELKYIKDMANLMTWVRSEKNELGLQYPDSQVNDAFDLWQCKNMNNQVKAVIGAIEYSVDNERESANDWDTIASYFADKDVEFVKDSIRKHLWQIKRKLIDDKDYEVEMHQLLAIYGETRTGKSKFLKLLASPIEQLTDYPSVSSFADTDRQRGLYKSFNVIFDEMSGSDKADANALKMILTARDMTNRIFHTQNSAPVKNNTTCCCSINVHIGELIKDPTGMMRYNEIEWLLKLSQVEDRSVFDRLNAVDWLRIWKSVDHRAEDPMKKHFKKIVRQSNKIRALTPFEQFIDDCYHGCVNYGFGDDGKSGWEVPTEPFKKGSNEGWSPRQYLFLNAFVPWCKERGFGHLLKAGQKKFSEEMNRLSKSDTPLIEAKFPQNVPHYRLVFQEETSLVAVSDQAGEPTRENASSLMPAPDQTYEEKVIQFPRKTETKKATAIDDADAYCAEMRKMINEMDF